MPFVFSITPGAAQATSGSANTEVNHLRMITGTTRTCSINALYVMGKGAALTAISGIVYRLKRQSAASTVGSAITPKPRQGATAAVTVASTGPTNGGAGTSSYQLAIGSGAAGPGGWVAPNPDSMVLLDAGGSTSTENTNCDLLSASGTTGLFIDYTVEFQE